MTTIAQRRVLEVLKNKIISTDERFVGYNTHLARTLYNILDLENERPHNIAQQVSREVTALGEILVNKKGNLE
ncbi:MAG: hypothetical protein OXG88_05910 [Gammaproteobacteria bacterium]|nr:hypothetical protein [Gammaproteobacteria bacterium]MCY3726917.1 hypothetical protein [Paracoccaceae bacterium]